MKLIEYDPSAGTVLVIEKGQSVRDQYKGQSLDDTLRNRVPLLEFYPARYRSIVNAVLSETTNDDVAFSASLSKVIFCMQVCLKVNPRCLDKEKAQNNQGSHLASSSSRIPASR